MSKKKQKITLDFSPCKFREYDKRCTQINTTRRKIFVEAEPLNKIIFIFYKDGRVKWVYYTSDFTYKEGGDDVWYYSHHLHIKAHTKKALLRQLRLLKFPKGMVLTVDPGVYYEKTDDCSFKVKIKSNPV